MKFQSLMPLEIMQRAVVNGNLLLFPSLIALVVLYLVQGGWVGRYDEVSELCNLLCLAGRSSSEIVAIPRPN